ncbi:MAG: DUF5667 domain-containing protein [Patescibacteria group bacterium]|jgi:hypothetical protein|nr:DUF5667 domain-containing protein [Patescibacteria group bacterium]
MNKLDKQLNSLPKPKMSLVKKMNLKYKLYVLIIQESFSFEFLLNRKFQHRAISFVLLLSLLFGLPLYSYASPGVNEKHILYPVKLAIEKIELKVANTDIEKQEKYEKFSERRLSEAEVLSENIKENEDRVAISNTIKAAVALKEKAREIAFKEGDGSEQSRINQREKLNNIASFVGIEEDDELVENIASAMDNIGENIQVNNNGRGEMMRNASSTKFNNGQIRSNNLESDDRLMGQGENSSDRITEDLENTERLLELKEKVEALKIDLKDDDYDETDVEALFEKLDKRVETVTEAIENEDQKNINGIINSTKAITNNAKHFIKMKGPNKEDPSKVNNGRGRGR